MTVKSLSQIITEARGAEEVYRFDGEEYPDWEAEADDMVADAYASVATDLEALRDALAAVVGGVYPGEAAVQSLIDLIAVTYVTVPDVDTPPDQGVASKTTNPQTGA